MNVLQLVFQIAIIAMVGLIYFNFRAKASQVNNELCIAQWFADMDTVVQGQRWRGERSMMVECLHMEKSFAGLKTHVLCVTRSGRWFLLQAETRFSLVTNWRIEPMSDEAAAKTLELSMDDLAAAQKALAWPQERAERADQLAKTKTPSTPAV
jgi:hypothetical protein